MNTEITENTTITVKAPINNNFNTSSINLTVSEVSANDLYIDIDNTAVATAGLTANTITSLAVNFTTNLNANLTKISIYHNVSTGGTIKFFLYNATWNATALRPEPNASQQEIYSELIPAKDFAWYDYTISNVYLNNSLTHNQTWFIVMAPVGGSYRWYYGNIASPKKTVSYSIISGNPWVFETNRHFCAKVWLSHPTPNPKPTDLEMRINSSLVTDDSSGVYDGYWINSTAFNSDGTGQLQFDFTVNWPNVTWIVDETEVIYAERTPTATSTYYIPSSGADVNWTVQYAVTQYNSTFTNFRINFTIPDIWTPAAGFYTDASNPITLSTFDSAGDYKIIQLPAPPDIGNVTWILNCTGLNYVKNIKTLKYDEESEIFYDNESIIPSIEFIAAYSGRINFDVYDSQGNSINTYITQILSNSLSFNFEEFNISNLNVSYFGEYYIQIWGNNSINQAFFLSKNIKILGRTLYKIIGICNNSEIQFNQQLNFILSYENIRNNNQLLPIDPTNVLWNDGENHSLNINNGTTGYYEFTIDTSKFLSDEIRIEFLISKPYYQNHTFTLVFKRMNTETSTTETHTSSISNTSTNSNITTTDNNQPTNNDDNMKPLSYVLGISLVIIGIISIGYIYFILNRRRKT
jgi:hypothetical protein